MPIIMLVFIEFFHREVRCKSVLEEWVTSPHLSPNPTPDIHTEDTRLLKMYSYLTSAYGTNSMHLR